MAEWLTSVHLVNLSLQNISSSSIIGGFAREIEIMREKKIGETFQETYNRSGVNLMEQKRIENLNQNE